MRATMLATAGALAFAFTIGTVSAADQFATLRGVKAVQMTAGELSAVKGMDHHFGIMVDTPNTASNGLLDPPASSKSAPQTEDPGQQPGRFETDWRNEEQNDVAIPGNSSVAPSYLGLSNACSNGVIILPGFVTC